MVELPNTTTWAVWMNVCRTGEELRKRRQEIEFWQTANGFNRLECSDADRQ